MVSFVHLVSVQEISFILLIIKGLRLITFQLLRDTLVSRYICTNT
jgi:hypothetical protein